jgi:ketosteroid isomerase-like protein
MTNSEIVSGLYDSFANGDVPAVLGAFADDIEWNEAEGSMYGGKYIGPNAVLENILMKFATEWEGFTVAPHKFIADGDTVVGLGTYSGKFLGTGKSVSVPFAHVWTMTDGKVARFDQFVDTVVMARSLGL